MIRQSQFPVEPWTVRETRLQLDLLAQSESVFALSNGHIGMRGNLDEGEPHGLPGSYVNSFYELRPLPYAEAGYGFPESGESLINVTNGKIIRLLVDDEPFDVRYGNLLAHERVLDLRAGTLSRSAEWVSPAGTSVRVRSRRLVSFTQRAVAAIEYSVEALSDKIQVIAQSELVANESLPRPPADPRVAAALADPLVPEEDALDGGGAFLLHRTRESDLLLATGMWHLIEGPAGTQSRTDTTPHRARTTVVCQLPKGQQLRIIKLLAYGWSQVRSRPALRDQVAAALTGARYSGLDGLIEQQRNFLDDFWAFADVEVDGDDELQQAVRFGLYHVLQSGARGERRPIPAKGLTGTGYDGHSFWDTEGFVLPVLTYTLPTAAGDALRWRYSTLELARERAEQLGLAGAAFPWRTISGRECSAYWPAGTAAFHVNADIADAVERYRHVTGSEDLEESGGLALLVETARLWWSLGHFGDDQCWHVDGVTGPDEYSAVADDNVFTNLMAARNLKAAAAAAERRPRLAGTLGVTAEEAESWRKAADAVYVSYDEAKGVHSQSEGFTRHEEWNFERCVGRYPLLLHEPYFELYRKQVVKQADLVLAMHWCSDAFTPEQKARNFDYYERRTVRDSSLSACTQAVLAAEVGHLELAYNYASEAAFIDLRDLNQNSRDGLHMASLAGAWIALVCGFGGLRDQDGRLSFAPQLPERIRGLRFHLRWQDWRLGVDINHERVVYQVQEGPPPPLAVRHDGEQLKVARGEPVTRPLVSRVPILPAPVQPPTRAPGGTDDAGGG